MADGPFANDVICATLSNTKTISKAENMPESPFLRIPGELRNEIYRSVVQIRKLLDGQKSDGLTKR